MGIRERSGSAELPVGGDDLADGEAVLGVVDRRREQLGPRPRCRTAGAAGPSRRRSRGPTSSAGRASGFRRAPARGTASIVGGRRRPAAGVEAVELAGSGVPDDGEQVAAEAARHRLDHAEHRVGRDRRVDGVAALAGAPGSPPPWPAADWSPPCPAGPSRPTASCARARRAVARRDPPFTHQAQPQHGCQRKQARSDRFQARIHADVPTSSGKWSVASEQWQVSSGQWQVVSGKWSVTACRMIDSEFRYR